MMKNSILLPLLVMINLTVASCQNQQKEKDMNTSEHTMIQQLTKAERDPSMMFYLNQSVDGSSSVEVLKNSEAAMISFLNSIPEEKINYKYGFTKWTVGEMLQHIITYEEVMTESALKIAGRNISESIGYYNQSTTVKGAKGKTKEEMLARFKKVRAETIRVFEDFSQEELVKMGIHEMFAASPRTMALCISGHQQHHFGIIQERYLD